MREPPVVPLAGTLEAACLFLCGFFPPMFLLSVGMPESERTSDSENWDRAPVVGGRG